MYRITEKKTKIDLGACERTQKESHSNGCDNHWLGQTANGKTYFLYFFVFAKNQNNTKFLGHIMANWGQWAIFGVEEINLITKYTLNKHSSVRQSSKFKWKVKNVINVIVTHKESVNTRKVNKHREIERETERERKRQAAKERCMLVHKHKAKITSPSGG